MVHIVLMGIVQGISNFNHQFDRFGDIKRPLFFDPLLKSFTVNKGHNNIIKIIVAAEIVYINNSRMVQAGGKLGFTMEALLELFVLYQLLVNNFNGHFFPQGLVNTQEYFPHPPGLHQILDFILVAQGVVYQGLAIVH